MERPPVATTRTGARYSAASQRTTNEVSRVTSRILASTMILHSGGAAFGFEHAGDQACGMIAEELAQRFFVIQDFMFFHEGDEIGGGIAGQGRFGEVGILRKEIFGWQWRLVKLQRPPPEMRIFLPIFSECSRRRARRPRAGFDGAEEAGGAGTEDDYVEVRRDIR